MAGIDRGKNICLIPSAFNIENIIPITLKDVFSVEFEVIWILIFLDNLYELESLIYFY